MEEDGNILTATDGNGPNEGSQILLNIMQVDLEDEQ